MLRFWAGSLAFACANTAWAEPLVLSLPIDCDLSRDCFIQQYVDRDPAADAANDYRCHGLTYDGHKGTDFSLASTKQMREGVRVLASADGVVTRLRDGTPDGDGQDRSSNRACGNGVVIEHGDGWETQYCHLRKDSVSVNIGQQVKSGQALGLVGQSGLADFPHVHLSVRHNGNVVDPFSPDSADSCTDEQTDGLWQETPPYQPGGLISIGFTDVKPSYDAVKAGTADQDKFTEHSPVMVLYAYGFGSRQGDILQITLNGPQGQVVNFDGPIKNRARFFQFAGKKKPRGNWPKGTYTGTAAILRDGAELDRIEQTITVE